MVHKSHPEAPIHPDVQRANRLTIHLYNWCRSHLQRHAPGGRVALGSDFGG